MNTKFCNKCRTEKLVSDFHNNKSTNDKLSPWCKVCNNLAHRNRYKDPPVKARRKEYQQQRKQRVPELVKRIQNNSKQKHLYGITMLDKEQLYLKQNGCCAICSQPISLNSINTDHNHITKKIRGLLCWNCNTAIGKLKADEKGIELLEKAIQYIQDF